MLLADYVEDLQVSAIGCVTAERDQWLAGESCQGQHRSTREDPGAAGKVCFFFESRFRACQVPLPSLMAGASQIRASARGQTKAPSRGQPRFSIWQAGDTGPQICSNSPLLQNRS